MASASGVVIDRDANYLLAAERLSQIPGFLDGQELGSWRAISDYLRDDRGALYDKRPRGPFRAVGVRRTPDEAIVVVRISRGRWVVFRGLTP